MSQFSSQPVSMGALRAGEGAAGTGPAFGVGSPAASQPLHAVSPGQAIFRLNIRRSLQLHRRLAWTVALAGIALSIVYFLRLWPQYLAQSLIYVQPSSPKVLQGGVPQSPYGGSDYESYLEQQMATAVRLDVLENALHKLPPGAWQKDGESDQAAAARLSHAIQVERTGAYQFTIGGRSPKPQLAAELANAVTSSYLQITTREEKAGDAQRIAILRDEQKRIQDELNADLSQQDALSKQLGVAAAATAAPDLIDTDIGKIRGDLITAETNYDQAAAQYAAMDAGQGNSSAAIQAEADNMIASDPGLTSMKTSLNTRRAALITQMSNLTPQNPEYQQDAAELAKINGTLDSMMANLRAKAAARIQEQLRTNLAQTAGVEARLSGQLRRLVTVAGSATPKLQQSNDLAADITRLQDRYTAVNDQLHNEMLEASAPGSVFLVSAAVPPLDPVSSGVVRNTLILIFAAISFGILIAVAAHKMDPKLYAASEVEQATGFAPMAQLPDFREVPDEVAEEHLLRLAASIEHACKEGHLKSCIFTGTAPGVGVTTVAAKVRDMLEAMGRPTALVNARRTPLQASRAAATETEVHAGSERGSRSTALLRQVSQEAGMKDGSLVLTDTAPLEISAETEYMARFADCVIVVMEAGVTTREQLRSAVQILQRLNVGTVGFVLNRVSLAKADPAFCQSVSAVERRIRIEGRSTAVRTARARHFEEESLPAAEQEIGQASAPPQPEQAIPAPAFAAYRATGGEPELAGAAAPAPLPQPAVSAPRVQQAPLPAPEPDPDIPWWLSEAYRQPPAPAAEILWQPAKTHPAKGASGQDAQQPAPGAASDAAASRLSGLRNIFFAAGGSGDLNPTREAAPKSGEPALPASEPRRPAEPLPPAVSRVFVPLPSHLPADGAALRKVIAAPEFLPPRPAAHLDARGHLREHEQTIHLDRREAYDEVAILPSWRGQYRRKD